MYGHHAMRGSNARCTLAVSRHAQGRTTEWDYPIGCNCYGRHSLRTPERANNTWQPTDPSSQATVPGTQTNHLSTVHASSTGTRVQYHNRLRLPAPS
jgi:hypothetical protein